jgi:hypothetical protein
MTSLLSPMLTGWKIADNGAKLAASQVLVDFHGNLCQKHEAELAAATAVVDELNAVIPRMTNEQSRKKLTDCLEEAQYKVRNARGSLKFNQIKKLAEERSVQSLSGRETPAKQALENYQNMLQFFFALRQKLGGVMGDGVYPISIPEQQIDITGAGHLRLYDLDLKLENLVSHEDGSLDIVIPEMVSRVALHNSATKAEESMPVAFRGVKIHFNPMLGPLILGALNLRFPIDQARVEQLGRAFAKQTTAFRDPQSGGLSPKHLGDHISISLDEVILREGDQGVPCDGRLRSDRDKLTGRLSELLASPMTPQKLDKVLKDELGLSGEPAGKVLNLLSLGLLGPEPEPQAVPQNNPVMVEREEEGRTIGNLVGSEELTAVSEALEVVEAQEVVSTNTVPQNVASPNRVLPDDDTTANDEMPELELSQELPNSLEPSSDIEDDRAVDISVSMSSSQVEASLTPDVAGPEEAFVEELAEISPEPLSRHNSLPDVSIEPELSASLEDKEALTPLTSEPEVAAAPETDTGIRMDELSVCKGISNLVIDSETGSPSAQFDMSAGLSGLFGKVHWLVGLLTGGKDIALEVTSVAAEGKLGLESPRVTVKSLGVMGWRSRLLNFWLKRKLAEEPVRLTLDREEEGKRLSLQRQRNIQSV